MPYCLGIGGGPVRDEGVESSDPHTDFRTGRDRCTAEPSSTGRTDPGSVVTHLSDAHLAPPDPPQLLGVARMTADGAAVTVEARNASDYSALAAQIRDSGLMARRYGYYWTRMILAAAAFAGVWVAVVLIGDSWWQLAVAAVLGDRAHAVRASSATTARTGRSSTPAPGTTGPLGSSPAASSA